MIDGLEPLLTRTASGREIARLDIAGLGHFAQGSWPSALTAAVLTMLDCPAPMAVSWSEDLVFFFNDAFRPAIEAHAPASMGKPFAEIWGGLPHDLATAVQGALDGQGSRVSDLAMGNDRPEEARWWDFSISPIRDDRAGVPGLLWLARETTELVLAQRTRQAASNRLREALAAGIPIGSWDWDVVNDRIYSDSQFALIYRVEPERAAAGSPLADFLDCVHRDDRPRVQAEIERSVATGEPFLSEYRIIEPQGRQMWVSAQGTPVMDENGRCVRFPGLSFDITAKMTLERDALGRVA